MIHRTPSCLLVVATLFLGCGGSQGDEDANATSNAAPNAAVNNASNVAPNGNPNAQVNNVAPPIASGCDSVPRASVDGGAEVSDEAGLRAALAAGGSVVLTSNITATAPFEVTADTVFDGGGHVIDGGGSTHLFVATRTNFTIQNVTLRNARNNVSDDEHFSRRSGAAIMASGGSHTEGPGVGSLTVVDVVFDDNHIKDTGPGDLRGGALYGFRMPDIVISGSTFTRNSASNGGAIGGLGSSFRIVNTTLQANFTTGTGPAGELEGHGGAMSLDALSQNEVTAYLDMCGTSWVDNVGRYGGGAFYLVTHGLTGSTVSIDRSVFSGNRTTDTESGQGGAIFLMDDDKNAGGGPNNAAVITASLFTDNEALSRGGGLWYWTVDGRLTVTNTTFHSNRTTQDFETGMGGAVAISQGPADFVHCTFSQNYAKFHGGGIQMGGDAVVSLQACIFHQNTSNRDGGWANFHTNRPADDNRGGNFQYLDEALAIDSNSDLPAVDGITYADPMLEPLADNGGPTMTMALDAGSPAVDGAPSDGSPASDQRGEARDGSPDSGAYEVQ